MRGRGLDPGAVAEWQRIGRDITITVVAAFMLIFETVFRTEPNAYVLGAGLAMLGVPPALRLDQARRSRRSESSPPEQPRQSDDPYDGPGGYYRQ